MRAKGRGRHLAIKTGLPEDVLFSGARVTMIAQGSVLIEGQRGVVELTGQRIRLRTADGVIAVMGEELKLRELSLDAAIITGTPVEAVAYGAMERSRR